MAGWLHSMVWTCRSKDMDNTIAVIGDSRVADGFSAKVADETGKPGEVKFTNIAVYGSSPRVWYYMLREIDPHASRFSVLTIMMSNYDESNEGDLANRERDVHYLAPILRSSDFFTFVGSYTSAEGKESAAISNLLKGTAFKSDILEFLGDPKKRLDLVKINKTMWRVSNYYYTGHPEALEGLIPDPREPGGVRLPPCTPPDDKLTLRNYFTRMNESKPEERVATCRELWLGKILDRYRGGRIRIGIFEIPRGPLHYLKPQAPPGATLLGLQRKYGFTIIPPETFGELERPQFFCDYTHLNTLGRQRFSEKFSPLLRQIAGASLTSTH